MANAIADTDVYVILGARAEEVFLKSPKANYFINTTWFKGMGNSIASPMEDMKVLYCQLAISPYLLKLSSKI